MRAITRLYWWLPVLCGIAAHTAAAEPLSALIKKIKPSIVAIGDYVPTRRPPESFRGTGFVVGDGRYVVTNNHVVQALEKDGNQRLIVISGTNRKNRVHVVELVGRSSMADLAVLKLRNDRLTPLALGNDSSVAEGDTVHFTGFPIVGVLGLYPVTHQGIISAITPIVIPQRSSRALTPALIKRLRDPYGIFQLDATAYPGNSGSPLFDQQGLVIGVINKVFIKASKESALEKPSGITYAIPVHFVQELLKQLNVHY